MRPTLSQCFPNPLTRQWPSTSNPVSCECQQLYALVCICCCLPKTHLLILHEGESNNMVTSMPKGPKYVDFKVTPRTSAEDFSSFLYRAELAATQAQQQQQLQLDAFSDNAMQPLRSTQSLSEGGRDAEVDMYSPASPSSAAVENPFAGSGRRPSTASSVGGGTHTAAPYNPSSPSVAGSTSGGGGATVGHHRRQVVVVCLHGIAVASPAVRSVLMDALTFAQVPYVRGAKAIPSLRIVAFCDYRACIAILPEPLRAGFALSTFVSALAMDSAVVLQSTDARTSNVVNKEYMLEIMNSKDGLPLVDTVVLSSAVARYMRHLMMTIQGSTLCEMAPGAMLIRRTAFFYRLLRVAAALFMPQDDIFTRRSNPRGASRGGPNERNSAWGETGLSTPQTSHYYATHQKLNSASAAFGAGGGGGGVPAAGVFAVNKDESGRILSLSHVVVSPSDVICLIPAMVAHHLSLPRAVVDVESRIMATRATMAGLGAPLLSDIAGRGNLSNQDSSSRRGTANVVCEDGTAGCPSPGLWDARMASLALARRPHTSVVAATVASRARRQQQLDAPADVSLYALGDYPSAPPTTTEAGAARNGNAPPPTSRHYTTRSPMSRRLTAAGAPSPVSSPLGETWHGRGSHSVLASIEVDESDFLYHDYLNYCELRDVVRSTLVCRTHPAPA